MLVGCGEGDTPPDTNHLACRQNKVEKDRQMDEQAIEVKNCQN